MKNKRIWAIATLIFISCLYLVVVGLKHNWIIPTAHIAGSIGLFGIFLLSSVIMMSGPESTPESKTQRFILGTSVQMILVLFFVLIAKYVWPTHFQEFVWYFMSFFVLMLVSQATWLLLLIRGN